MPATPSSIVASEVLPARSETARGLPTPAGRRLSLGLPRRSFRSRTLRPSSGKACGSADPAFRAKPKVLVKLNGRRFPLTVTPDDSPTSATQATGPGGKEETALGSSASHSPRSTVVPSRVTAAVLPARRLRNRSHEGRRFLETVAPPPSNGSSFSAARLETQTQPWASASLPENPGWTRVCERARGLPAPPQRGALLTSSLDTPRPRSRCWAGLGSARAPASCGATWGSWLLRSGLHPNPRTPSAAFRGGFPRGTHLHLIRGSLPFCTSFSGSPR